jgi:hypothetical protein
MAGANECGTATALTRASSLIAPLAEQVVAQVVMEPTQPPAPHPEVVLLCNAGWCINWYARLPARM